jgi:hypothetical protein
VGGSADPPATDDLEHARATSISLNPNFAIDPPPAGLPHPHLTPPVFSSWRPGGAPHLFGSNSGGGGGAGHIGGGGGGGGDLRGLGELVIVLVPIAIAACVVVTVTLIASEGMRYDGWIAVNPDEPLYIRFSSGVRAAVPLSQLTPEIVGSAVDAEMFEGHEPRFERLARSPLDRTGLFFAAGLDVTAIPLPTGVLAAAGARAAFGGFPTDSFGIALTGDALISLDGSAYLASLGGEVQWLPARWFGIYGGANYAGRWTFATAPGRSASLTSSSSGWIARAGLHAEAPLTTRLAIHFRAGAAASDFGDGSVHFVPETSVGFSIY